MNIRVVCLALVTAALAAAATEADFGLIGGGQFWHNQIRSGLASVPQECPLESGHGRPEALSTVG